MDVYGHPTAVRFAETSQLAGKFFSFVNGEGRGLQQRQSREEEKVLLRRQVQELFNKKYSELLGRSAKVPYKDVKRNQSRLRVTNMPGGIDFKHPSNYGVGNLRQILTSKDNLVFQLDNGNTSSTSSAVALPASSGTIGSTAEMLCTTTTDSSPLTFVPSSTSTSNCQSLRETVPVSTASSNSLSVPVTVSLSTATPSSSVTASSSFATGGFLSVTVTLPSNTANSSSLSVPATVSTATRNTLSLPPVTVTTSAATQSSPTLKVPISTAVSQPSAATRSSLSLAVTILESTTTSTSSSVRATLPFSTATISSPSMMLPISSTTTSSSSVEGPTRQTSNVPSSSVDSNPARRKRKQTTRQNGGDNKRKRDLHTERCQAYLCQEPDAQKKQTLKWIHCDDCEKWFHFECVGIQTAPRGRYVCGCSVENFDKSNYPSRMSLLSPDISSVKGHLKNILYANTASKRHTLFNRNKQSDVLHLSCAICGPFSSSMIRRFTLEVQSFLPEFWSDFNQHNTRMCSYVLSVLVPEV
ncbi:serine-rich adhesin for platelets-like [Montipora capricornis]|uniref:serine-rich adhesin for platelets-like n=1 Tax=Montipora capricornis TaxID=246305 RepID=UPI0035F19F72